jgi:hypothetical protein
VRTCWNGKRWKPQYSVLSIAFFDPSYAEMSIIIRILINKGFRIDISLSGASIYLISGMTRPIDEKHVLPTTYDILFLSNPVVTGSLLPEKLWRQRTDVNHKQACSFAG